jgi:hypothetical protein
MVALSGWERDAEGQLRWHKAAAEIQRYYRRRLAFFYPEGFPPPEPEPQREPTPQVPPVPRDLVVIAGLALSRRSMEELTRDAYAVVLLDEEEVGRTVAAAGTLTPVWEAVLRLQLPAHGATLRVELRDGAVAPTADGKEEQETFLGQVELTLGRGAEGGEDLLLSARAWPLVAADPRRQRGIQVRFGRIVALYYRSSALYQIR